MVRRADSDEPIPGDPAAALSKRLSFVLRHAPDSIGVRLDPAGWVDIPDLLAGLARDGLEVTAEDLQHIVDTSDKQRFAIDASGRRIRANHGHSVEIDLGLSPQQPPALLFHGTPERFLDEILLTGLSPKARQFVHLSTDIETARAVGARRGRPVVLDIHAGRMADHGVAEFFRTSSGVWLVDHVPPEYLSLHGKALIEFVRLTEIPLSDVIKLLDEPRNARHMPLAGEFSEAAAAEWVRDKDGQWEAYGYGPWAVLVNGDFAGWGGFQHEENGADFGLVLLPDHWGRGAEITRAALDRGFGELGLDEVIIALPFSRRPTRAVARFGFVPDGEVSYGDAAFQQYRVTRDGWAAARAGLQ